MKEFADYRTRLDFGRNAVQKDPALSKEGPGHSCYLGQLRRYEEPGFLFVGYFYTLSAIQCTFR